MQSLAVIWPRECFQLFLHKGMAKAESMKFLLIAASKEVAAGAIEAFIASAACRELITESGSTRRAETSYCCP